MDKTSVVRMLTAMLLDHYGVDKAPPVWGLKITPEVFPDIVRLSEAVSCRVDAQFSLSLSGAVNV